MPEVNQAADIASVWGSIATLINFAGSCLLLWVSVRTVEWRRLNAILADTDNSESKGLEKLKDRLRALNEEQLRRLTLTERIWIAAGFGCLCLGTGIQLVLSLF